MSRTYRAGDDAVPFETELNEAYLQQALEDFFQEPGIDFHMMLDFADHMINQIANDELLPAAEKLVLLTFLKNELNERLDEVTPAELKPLEEKFYQAVLLVAAKNDSPSPSKNEVPADVEGRAKYDAAFLSLLKMLLVTTDGVNLGYADHYQRRTLFGSSAVGDYVFELKHMQQGEDYSSLVTKIVDVAKNATEKRENAGFFKRVMKFSGRRDSVTRLHEMIASYAEDPKGSIEQITKELERLSSSRQPAKTRADTLSEMLEDMTPTHRKPR